VSITFDDRPACDAISGIKGKTRKVTRTMNRNVLYLIIGALIVAVAVFGYQLYQERQKTTGIDINIGKSGISIEKK
jgi:magnesium-transporting ATPase (P-type)